MMVAFSENGFTDTRTSYLGFMLDLSSQVRVRGSDTTQESPWTHGSRVHDIVTLCIQIYEYGAVASEVLSANLQAWNMKPRMSPSFT